MKKIVRLSHVSSTSAVALRYLTSGKYRPPFAVVADEQDCGRGRDGRRWHSPRGNLYLSMVFAVKPEPLLSLYCVALVCQWLRQRPLETYSICKWPNDILYGGKKLAGILCEGIANSQLIVGIGVNINVVPEQLRDRATSINQIIGHQVDLSQLSTSLVAKFVKEFPPNQQTDIVTTFELHTPSGDELWCDNSHFYRRTPAKTNGHLQLTSLNNGQTITLATANHRYRWVYQAPANFPLIVADVGSSVIKIGLFIDNAPLQVFSANNHHELLIALKNLRQAMARDDRWLIYSASVNNTNYQLLATTVAQFDFQLSELGDDKKPFRYRGRYNFADLGLDRLAAIEAYLDCYHRPGRSAVIVMFGTATTIDYIGANGGHLGGNISAGLRTSLQTLGRQTDLPAGLVEEKLTTTDLPPITAVARDTVSAVLNGVLRPQLSWLLNRKARNSFIVVSGGCSDIVVRQLKDLKSRFHHDPHLVVKGIKRLVVGGGQ